jgi:hypothetical protein
MSENLIRVAKDGFYLEVHASTVAAHQEAGWRITDPSPEISAEPEPEAPLTGLALARAAKAAKAAEASELVLDAAADPVQLVDGE